MPESEAKSWFPNLVVASLGAQKKEKPGEQLTCSLMEQTATSCHTLLV